MTSPHKPSGVHLIADLHGIEPLLLADGNCIGDLLARAAQSAGAHVLFSHFHSFGDGDGITGVVLLAESHISIHTWPEQGFAAVDIFMCGNARPERALQLICESMGAGRFDVRQIARGGEAVAEGIGAHPQMAAPR